MKVNCQASCVKCYHERGRTQDFDENDLIWFCVSCKKNFLCDIGLARGSRGYSCFYCGTTLIKEEVDKIIIEKKSVPGKQTETGDLYQKLLGKKDKAKKRFWRKSSKNSHALPAYEQSQISELCDYEGLTIPIILEFARDFQIKKLKDLHRINTQRELLQKLAIADSNFIPFLYSSLVKFESNPRGFNLRFAVFSSSIFPQDSKILLPQNDYECDIKIFESSGETWVYCLEEDMDIKNLENFAQRAFSVDFKDVPNIKQVFFVAKSFSYLAKGLIQKFQSVLTGIQLDATSSEISRSIPLLLWQTIPGKKDFQNVSA